MKLKYVGGVTVDAKERERGQRSLPLFRGEGVDARIRLLEFGDYLVNGKVVFEYKSVTDFINSIFDESLFNEVYNQSVKYRFSYLLVVGSFDKEMSRAYYANPRIRDRYPTMTRYKNWVRRVYKGAIRRCRVVCNVICVGSEKEAFYEILAQSEKCLSNKSYAGVVRKKTDKISPMESFLTSIYGVGNITAKKLVTEFNVTCLSDLLEITAPDMIKHGFNRNVVKNYYKYVYGEELGDEIFR